MTKQTEARLTPQDVYNAFNGKDLDHFASLLADDYVFEGDSSQRVGKAGFLDFIRHYWETFPDGKITGTRNVTEGNIVVGEGIFEGTHQGDFMGVPGTGKPVVFPFAEVFEFQGTKVKTMRVYNDTVAIVRQIGVAPIGFLTG